jgi:hypothetical protein
MAKVGQDFHDFFVMDLLHKFEISIWKLVLMCLIRMLHVMPGGEECVALLNKR